MADSAWRVKVYVLTPDGQWDEKGTGTVTCQHNDATGGSVVTVISEDNGESITNENELSQDYFHLHSENIITWTEADEHNATKEYALSFEENQGCDDIWSTICGMQGRSDCGENIETAIAGEMVVLPEATLDNLGQIAEALADVPPPQKEPTAQFLMDQDFLYVQKLMGIISDCADLEDVESLQHCFVLVKGIMSLNEPGLLEMLFSDEHFPEFITALDYDPDLKGENTKHRVFLLETAKMKEVIPIDDPEILTRIRQNFRIQYLKDTLLRRVVDDPAFNLINSLLVCNHVHIVTQLHNRAEFLQELFSSLASTSTSRVRREEQLAFLNELISLSKYLQPGSREVFFSSLVESSAEPFFDIFVAILDDPEASLKEKMHGTEVILSTICHDPTMLREYIVVSRNHPPPPSGFGGSTSGSGMTPGSHAGGGGGKDAGKGMGAGVLVGAALERGLGASERRPLLLILLQLLLEEDETGVLAQVTDIVRLLLDKDTMEDPSRDEFLNVFYEYYMGWLLEPLKLSPVVEQYSARDVAVKASQYHVLELLCFCVQIHGFRIKYFVMQHGVLEKALLLLRYREKHLKLIAIRFLRTCIGQKDEFYNRHLVSHKLLGPVMEAFFENGDRNNLVNSTVLEMVEFIRTENIKSLMTPLVNTYRDRFEGITYVRTFQQLLLRYDQNEEVASNPNQFSKVAAAEQKRRVDTETEDAYFNADSDDEEEAEAITAAASKSGEGEEEEGLIGPPAPVTIRGKGKRKREGGGDEDGEDDDDDDALPPGLKPLVAYGDSDSDSEDDEEAAFCHPKTGGGGDGGVRVKGGFLSGRKRTTSASSTKSKIAFVFASKEGESPSKTAKSRVDGSPSLSRTTDGEAGSVKSKGDEMIVESSKDRSDGDSGVAHEKLR